MTISPGPFAPTVTQHVAGTPTTDVYNDEVDAFSDRSVIALAEYPGNSLETDTAAGDTLLADLVLLVPADLTVSRLDEWTASDGLRYRVQGQPGRYRNPMTGTAVTQVNLRRIS